jgi:hypothetical protein
VNKLEFLVKLSREGRMWVDLLAPILLSFATGLHLPQPGYMKGKNADSRPNSANSG